MISDVNADSAGLKDAYPVPIDAYPVDPDERSQLKILQETAIRISEAQDGNVNATV
jgi:hypothetical protein